MRITGVEAAIAHYREAGTKKDAHNRNCAQMGSAQLGVLLYIKKKKSNIFFFVLKSSETYAKNILPNGSFLGWGLQIVN